MYLCIHVIHHHKNYPLSRNSLLSDGTPWKDITVSKRACQCPRIDRSLEALPTCLDVRCASVRPGRIAAAAENMKWAIVGNPESSPNVLWRSRVTR